MGNFLDKLKKGILGGADKAKEAASKADDVVDKAADKAKEAASKADDVVDKAADKVKEE
jgi:F0F1-type ATP synthase membrane subunit b/b'